MNTRCWWRHQKGHQGPSFGFRTGPGGGSCRMACALANASSDILHSVNARVSLGAESVRTRFGKRHIFVLVGPLTQ